VSKRNIGVITATRAEYGLLYWLIKELNDDADVNLKLYVSGTHLSKKHGHTIDNIISDGFPIAEQVDIDIDHDDVAGITHSLALATEKFGKLFANSDLDLIVVLGDRYEILGAAQAAMIARIPIAHLYGGEATEGLIDEAIRHSLTKMSHLHFVSTDIYAKRVIQMGENPETVFNVGAACIDNIEKLTTLSREELIEDLAIDPKRPIFLITYHPETLKKEEQKKDINNLLAALDTYDANCIFTGVNADTGGGVIDQAIQDYAAAHKDRVRYVTSLGQTRYLSAMKHCDVVIGNSSSGIIEAPVVGKPTINIGLRQEGRLRAASIIDCSHNQAAIKHAIDKALSQEFQDIAARKETPYGTVGVAERIAKVIKTHSLFNILYKRFYDQ